MRVNWFKININYILEDLVPLIALGYVNSYVWFLIYLKQGEYCKDCEFGVRCNCNYCKNCEFNYCLCNLNLKNKYTNAYDWEFEDRSKIRKINFTWILNNINIKYYKIFADSITRNEALTNTLRKKYFSFKEFNELKEIKKKLLEIYENKLV